MEGGAGDWRRLPTLSSRLMIPTSRSRNSTEIAERTEQPRQFVRLATAPTTSSTHNHPPPPPEEEDGRLSAFVQIEELSKLLECPVQFLRSSE
ncbi:unnamed protein product [Allacma fusca]|uniref:Uncharacterized protein n=1 Tax=Allacma fusca TaxID=39272 RepID=A0A8J2LIZ5_9HEXA|nr:unnamed protein product [Allacma fusca]